MKAVQRCIHLAAVIMTAACGAGPDAGERAQAPDWVAEPTVRAGSVDGPGSLTSVSNVAIGPDDAMLVAQYSPPRISVFDRDGRFVRTVGRAGPGPGEFGVLGRIGWTGDTLWAVGRGRVHLFDSALGFVRTIAPTMPDPPPGVNRVLPGPLMADGSILGIPFSFRGADSEPVMLVAQDGSAGRVVARVSSGGRSVDVELASGSTITVSNPWPDFPLWLNAVDGRSLVVVERAVPAEASDAAFRVVRIGLGGDTLVDRALAYSPVPLDEATERRAYRMLAEGHARRRPESPSDVEAAIRDRLTAPAFLPPVTELVVGEDGTIWLRREETRTDSVDWHLFDASGGMIGRVRLPTALEVHAADADRVWGVVRDSLDVPFVQVFEVGPAE